MKRETRWIGAAMVAGLIGVAMGAEKGEDFAKWSHVAVVEVPEKPAKGLAEADLPTELLAVAREDLGDLRLVDGIGKGVPFVVRGDRAEQAGGARSEAYRPERMFNATFVPGKSDTVTVDFGEGAREKRTRIDVETPGTNYKRQVTVEASSDGAAWQVLREAAWLFRVNYEGGNFEKRDVSLPENDFRYLRITVTHAADDPQRVAIEGVTAWRVIAGPAKGPKWVEVAARSTATREVKERRSTEIEMDLGDEKMPVREVELAVEDANFLRPVEVLGRNVKTRTIIEPVENGQPRKREVEEEWRHIGSGSVYRLPGGGGGKGEATTGLTVGANGGARYVLVRIWNRDDQPLKVEGVKVRRAEKFVDFRAESAGTYRLYAGNEGAGRPEYDLEHFAEKLREEGVTAVRVGAVAKHGGVAAATKGRPWSEEHAVLLWVALLGVLGVLGWLVLRQARAAGAVKQSP